MSDSDAYRDPGEDEGLQAVADDSRQLRRRLSSFAGIPADAAARTPDPLPDMDTALDRLHAARRAAGMPDLDDDEGLALGVQLARETREELAALDQ
jgi:hypothetical protein